MSATLPIVLADSIVDAATWEQEKVVVSGSHGGVSAAAVALRSGVHGVLFNDAGVGKDRAGIAGLFILARYGIYAAAVDAFSAEIGQAMETRNGRISHVNELARAIGIVPGMEAIKAAHLMACAPKVNARGAKRMDVGLKTIIVCVAASGHRIVAVDSNSMIGAGWENDVVFTGSHGGRVGSRSAISRPVLAVFYNDAGVGKNGAGVSRLFWLERHGVAAATVAALSARIGVGMDTYRCGIISHANAPAVEFGIEPGMRAADAGRRILEKVSMP
jgi:hypothetical protein